METIPNVATVRGVHERYLALHVTEYFLRAARNTRFKLHVRSDSLLHRCVSKSKALNNCNTCNSPRYTFLLEFSIYLGIYIYCLVSRSTCYCWNQSNVDIPSWLTGFRICTLLNLAGCTCRPPGNKKENSLATVSSTVWYVLICFLIMFELFTSTVKFIY